MASDWKNILREESDGKHVIPKDYRADMRVPGVIYASGEILDALYEDNAPWQVVNVAALPGIQLRSIAMPDIHYGYGFPIGGVAATDIRDGVISPGGVGFDINCGVRLLRTNLSAKEVKDKSRELADALYSAIPCGVGSEGDIRLSFDEIKRVLKNGAQWAVRKGYGWESDIEYCEENGMMEAAGPDILSRRAMERGLKQLGTLGSGNHFIEVQWVTKIYDDAAARAFGIEKDMALVMIHSGSRGLGAQVCTEYVRAMKSAMKKYDIDLPDNQLACAPVTSSEGEEYYAAMGAAANYAWANRQCMSHLVRETFGKVFRKPAERLGMHLLYDVAHNIAKREEHAVDGKMKEVVVHRKGATRAFPSGHSDVPSAYRAVGQPVIVPGDMGRESYLLVGEPRVMEDTFGSICHGAGRLKSRTAAKAQFRSADVIDSLATSGIILRARDRKTVVEEAPETYKNVSAVVDTCVRAGLARRVARMKPIVVIKG